MGTLQFLVSIFSIICLCLLFQKANLEWWLPIIPFYGQYKKFELAGYKNYYFVYLGVGFLASILFSIPLFNLSSSGFMDWGYTAPTTFLCWLFAMILIIICYVLGAIVNYKLGKMFGQSDAFCIGMALVPIVFTAIIAFDERIQCKPDIIVDEDDTY